MVVVTGWGSKFDLKLWSHWQPVTLSRQIHYQDQFFLFLGLCATSFQNLQICLAKCDSTIVPSRMWFLYKAVKAVVLISLTLNFLVAVLNTLNTKTHSSKEMADLSSENADVESICYCEQRMKSTPSLTSECVKTKLCKLCTSFTWHLHCSYGMVWYRTFRVNEMSSQFILIPTFLFHKLHLLWYQCVTLR